MGRNDLKKCPFCGGNARIMDSGNPHWAFCESCGARISDKSGTKCEEAWNRRTDVRDESSWVYKRVNGVEGYECEVCGAFFPLNRVSVRHFCYCPNCGLKM